MTSERLFNSFIPPKTFIPPKQISGYAGSRTNRTLDCSYPGLFVPSMDYSYLGLFVPWTIRTVTGWFVPCWEIQHSLYSVIKKILPKNPPEVFWHFFPKRLGIFSPNFTCLLYVHIYGRLQIFIQLSPTLMNFDESSSDGTQHAFRPMVDVSIFTVRRYALHGLSYRNSVRPSVCPSVCHTRALCPHGSTYDHDFFTIW